MHMMIKEQRADNQKILNLAKIASGCLSRANPDDFVFLLSQMAKLKIAHPVLKVTIQILCLIVDAVNMLDNNAGSLLACQQLCITLEHQTDVSCLKLMCTSPRDCGI